jgi:hypothetical protein
MRKGGVCVGLPRSRKFFVAGLNDDDVARFLATTCEKPVTAIKIYSERELAKELEKAAAILVPEQDWSARMIAMQRLCGLVLGGEAARP